jgi:hypothetical protein
LDINGAWETIRENIKISAKEIIGYYEVWRRMLKTIGSNETCSGYRIQV